MTSRGEREKGLRGCVCCEGEGWVAMSPREAANARRKYNLRPFLGNPETEKPCPECLGPKFEAEEQRQDARDRASSKIRVGDEVSHPLFGLGKVEEISGGGRGQTSNMTVKFDKKYSAVIPESDLKKVFTSD